MHKSVPVSLAILFLSILLLAACRPTPATGLPATLPATSPVTQPAYPPPVTPTREEQATPTNEPTSPAPATVAPELTPPYPPPVTLGPKATPVSDSPAAGVCDLQEGVQVTFEIFPDIPSPRCAQALPQQRLKVINRTDYDLDVSIASFQDTLAPGEETIFQGALGDYLLPGVHVVTTSAYGGSGGPELWLLEEVPTGTPGYPAP